jgi:hypothetical protein
MVLEDVFHKECCSAWRGTCHWWNRAPGWLPAATPLHLALELEARHPSISSRPSARCRCRTCPHRSGWPNRRNPLVEAKRVVEPREVTATLNHMRDRAAKTDNRSIATELAVIAVPYLSSCSYRMRSQRAVTSWSGEPSVERTCFWLNPSMRSSIAAPWVRDGLTYVVPSQAIADLLCAPGHFAGVLTPR